MHAEAAEVADRAAELAIAGRRDGVLQIRGAAIAVVALQAVAMADEPAAARPPTKLGATARSEQP